MKKFAVVLASVILAGVCGNAYAMNRGDVELDFDSSLRSSGGYSPTSMDADYGSTFTYRDNSGMSNETAVLNADGSVTVRIIKRNF
jgi:hypothetical protein